MIGQEIGNQCADSLARAVGQVQWACAGNGQPLAAKGDSGNRTDTLGTIARQSMNPGIYQFLPLGLVA